jgi:hypothetical protein
MSVENVQHLNTRNRFFSPTSSSATASKARLDLGGFGNCGYLALAASFLDNARSFKSDMVQKVLVQYKRYFPEHSSLSEHLTPHERLQHLVKKMGLHGLVHTLDYVLRQMAVDEVSSNPSLYRGAFVVQDEGTSPASMRKRDTWIDETLITALSNVLNTPIEVNAVLPGKTLPLRLTYNSEAPNPKLHIQLEGKHYVALVAHPHRFSPEEGRSVRVTEPVNVSTQDKSLPEILKIIAEDDIRQEQLFKTTQHRLKTMVAAGELTQTDLLQIYVQEMPGSDYLQGRGKYIDKEMKSQAFSHALQRYQNNAIDQGSEEHYLTHELIHAIARGISVGQIKMETLSSALEHESPSSYSTASR